MRTTSLLFVIALASACGGGNMDDDGGTGMDGGGDTDAGPVECPSGQHQCGSDCVDLMPNVPSNGCALGCGDPCEVADAVCISDGTCGMVGCEPDTCESLFVECGIIDNGCGSRFNCGGCDVSLNEQCIDGACVAVCATDANEPNDDYTTLSSLGTLGDVAEPVVMVNGILDPDSDEDWFYYRIADETGDFGAPAITVTLEGEPAGSDYSVTAYFVCDKADQQSTCGAGDVDNSLGTGCTSSGLGTDMVIVNTDCGGLGAVQDGDLYIRVVLDSGPVSCDEYTVRTSVM